jgi:hypothetical protein
MAEIATVQKTTLSEQLRARIAEVADKASQDDRKALTELIGEATQGKYSTKIVTLTAAMSAQLFVNHNGHNRDWSPLWSEELARRMTEGLWCPNNASVGFYIDGVLADGQNRSAASALAGFTLVTPVVFGIKREAITTIDNSKMRHASDAAKLDGITNAKRKEVLVKTVAAYLAKVGDKSALLRSETEIAKAIEANNVMLEDAIEIGASSAINIATPQLKEMQACSSAYLMLKGGWPTQRIREKLALFQTGVSEEGESSPFFQAQSVLNTAREAKKRKDRLTPLRELGIIMLAMQMSVKGITAVQRAKLKAQVERELPVPTYPGEELQQAA